MTHTPPSEAAASSPDHRLQASALPEERGLQDIARNVLGYYPATMQAMAVEILRLRAQCLPTAEIEKLRHAAREENRLHGHLSNIGSALSEPGHPRRHKGDELERIRDLAGDRDAWKHKADTLGGDLNRIRALVPTASDEQTTFDAVQAYLAKRHEERDASSKALFDAAIALEEFDGAHGTSENLAPRIRALLAERQRLRDLAERNGKAATERADLLARCGRAVGAKMDDDVPVTIMGRIPAEVERVVAHLRAELAASEKRVAELGCSLAMTPKPALTEEAQTAIAAMRDVGPELAKAGIHVGPRCSHAEGVAQLRGERDRWREKFEDVDQEAANAARWGISMGKEPAVAGFAMRAPKEAGLYRAVLEALAELTRLRKKSKRDQVAKQQALLDEIARLFPGKGPLLERVKHAAKVDEPQLGLATTKQLLEELQARAEVGGYASYRTVGGEVPNWLEATRRTEPKRDVAMAPIRGLVDEAFRNFLERRSCKEPKVGPATGQPRTEVPLDADGSGTVVELGEAFREAMKMSSPSSSAYLRDQRTGESFSDTRLRFLHTAVAELAKVVDRMVNQVVI